MPQLASRDRTCTPRPCFLIRQAAIAGYQQKISELKRELAMHDQLSNRSKIQYEPFSTAQKSELRMQAGWMNPLIH